MINFKNINKEVPYRLFKENYDMALSKGQKSIEAFSISSYNTKLNEVSSRYVNLKYVINDEFIFFSNYNSPKAKAFHSHNQIAVLFFWPSINTQIRMKAFIKKTSKEYNQAYFSKRSPEKNALAISSNQSQQISDFDKVIKQYNHTKEKIDLETCPEYWGGFSFIPYEIEFWVGNKFRINQRDLYKKDKSDSWTHCILEP